MAEMIVSPVAERIIGKLASFVSDEISLLRGVPDELRQLEETITRIHAVLLDADQKPFLSNQEKDFVQKLKDVLYDADDLLDRVAVEAHRRKENQMGEGRRVNLLLYLSYCDCPTKESRMQAIQSIGTSEESLG